jgi:hypothetical protein
MNLEQKEILALQALQRYTPEISPENRSILAEAIIAIIEYWKAQNITREEIIRRFVALSNPDAPHESWMDE